MPVFLKPGDVMGSFIWYELMAGDGDRAAAFYAAVTGWKIGPGDPNLHGYRLIRRDDGGNLGGLLPLSQDMKSFGARPAWMPYLHVKNVETALAAILADGGRVLVPPVTIDAGTFAMVNDPQGVPIYIMAPVPPPGQPDARSDVFSRTGMQRVSWNELATPDLAAAKAFYARHFGFEFNESMPMGPMGDYCFIDAGGERVGAMMQHQGGPETPLWIPVFRVPSVQAAAAAITGHGGGAVRGPMQVPGGEWVVFATDPDGARFGLVSSGEKP